MFYFSFDKNLYFIFLKLHSFCQLVLPAKHDPSLRRSHTVLSLGPDVFVIMAWPYAEPSEGAAGGRAGCSSRGWRAGHRCPQCTRDLSRSSKRHPRAQNVECKGRRHSPATGTPDSSSQTRRQTVLASFHLLAALFERLLSFPRRGPF